MTEILKKSKTVSSQSEIKDDLEARVIKYVVKVAKIVPRIASEASSIALTMAILWLGALGVLMNRPSVDLKWFKPHYEQWFSGAFAGQTADIETYKARWIHERKTIEISAINIAITGKDGAQQDITEIRGEFALTPKLLSRPVLKHLYINGGALTLARDRRGRTQIGLGAPETFERVGPLWLSKNKIDNSSSAQLDNITEIIVKSTQVYVKDEITQLSLSFANVDGQYNKNGKNVTVDSQGDLLTQTEQSPYNLKLNATTDRQLFSVQFDIQGVRPVDIAPHEGPFSVLANLDAPVDLKLNVETTGFSKLTALDIDLNVRAGAVKTRSSFKALENAHIKAAYDVKSQVINISDFAIKSEPLSGKMLGTIRNIGSAKLGFFKKPIIFDIAIDDIHINPGAKYEGPINLTEIVAAGELDIISNQLNLSALNINYGEFQIGVSAFIQLLNGKLNVLNIDGKSHGTLHPQDILSLWPNDVVLGGRNWVRKSLLAGDFSNFDIHISLDEDDFARGIVKNDHVNISFDAQNVDIRYLRKMPWLRGNAGHGIFRGNQLEYIMTGGYVDGLALEKGRVFIPQIAPKGSDFTIDLYGRGKATEMLRISDFEPLGIATRFGINPNDFGGNGNIHLQISRPLLETVNPDRMIYDLSGRFSHVSAPVGIGANTLNNGEIALHINNTGMEIIGPVKLGKWQTHLDWRKTFNSKLEEIPAHYTLSGVLTRDNLDGFGIGLRRYFGGEIDVVLTGEGNGLSVQAVDIAADFTKSEVNIGSLWSKELGEEGKLLGRLIIGENGGGKLNNFEILADGLLLAGSIDLADDFRLKSLDVPKAFIDGFIDARIQAHATPQGILTVDVTGNYLNLTSWVDRAFNFKKNVLTAPISMTASLERLSLNDNYHLNKVVAEYSYNSGYVENAKLAGNTDNGAFLAEIMRKDDRENRQVHIEIPDASHAILTLLGLDSIKDGVLFVDGYLPLAGEKGGLTGAVTLTDFTLIRAPAFAQILSLASLKGMADTFSGSGMEFANVAMDFSFDAGILQVRNGRASGAALGLTGEGDINFVDKVLDFNGVLVPSYTVNSILGDIPLLGGIMVGKKGEGMFALNYSVKGPMASTQVNINPLSALTPGFLRRIFDVKRKEITDPNVKDLIESQKQ